MKLLPQDQYPKVPRQICVCPICDADLIIADIDTWEINGDGTLSVEESGLHVGCVNEPDFDGRSKEWDKFQKWHYPAHAMEEWWDSTRTVFGWLSANYRFTRPKSEELEMLAAWNAGKARKVTA